MSSQTNQFIDICFLTGHNGHNENHYSSLPPIDDDDDDGDLDDGGSDDTRGLSHQVRRY